jgi:type II secretory pathway component PulM
MEWIKSLGWKQRWRLALVGIALLCVLAWKLNISKAIQAKREVTQLKARLTEAKLAGQEIARLESNTQVATGPREPDAVFNLITAFCEEKNLSIEDLPSPKRYEEEGLKFERQHIKLKGELLPMIQLVNQIERAGLGQAVASWDIFNQYNRVSKTRELHCEIVLQANLK